jgi:hypothetical protein
MILLKRFSISLYLLFLEFTIHWEINSLYSNFMLIERTPEDFL